MREELSSRRSVLEKARCETSVRHRDPYAAPRRDARDPKEQLYEKISRAIVEQIRRGLIAPTRSVSKRRGSVRRSLT